MWGKRCDQMSADDDRPEMVIVLSSHRLERMGREYRHQQSTMDWVIRPSLWRTTRLERIGRDPGECRSVVISPTWQP